MGKSVSTGRSNGLVAFWRRNAPAYAFLTPWLFGFFVLTLYPMLYSLWLSFTDYDFTKPDATQFIGLGNYVKMFGPLLGVSQFTTSTGEVMRADRYYLMSLSVTFTYVFASVPLTLIFALAVASRFRRTSRRRHCRKSKMPRSPTTSGCRCASTATWLCLTGMMNGGSKIMREPEGEQTGSTARLECGNRQARGATMDDPIDLLRQLVAINSVNPAIAPDGPGETELARFVADWCAARSIETHWIEPVAGRPSVVAVARGTGGGRSLMLNAHLDTVDVVGMDAPFMARRDGARLYGRGALDMKAGLAAAMVVLAAAHAQRLAGDVILAAVADEEHGSLGTRALLADWTADACIIPEPTDLQICLAHRGFAVIELELIGRAAHTAQPQAGANAITAAGRVLHQIEQRDHQLRAAAPHPLLGHASLQATLIKGGHALFTLPAHCQLSVERRTLPGEAVSDTLAEIDALIVQADLDSLGVKARPRLVIGREPWSIPSEAPLVQKLQSAMSHAGLTSSFWGAPYWMEAALFAAAGIPAVVFGPGGNGLHAADEWVDVHQVYQCADTLWNTAQLFCATQDQAEAD